jgi:hypothetical protein
MILVDWTAIVLGLAIGTVMSAVYFVGLAVGMRLALRTQSPIRILSVSAMLRIAALLGVGWVVVVQGGPWAALGYAIAFLAVRIVATIFARIDEPARGPL